jgi:hypothetical protein
MRVLVFLLVLVNLLFFTWAQGYFGTSANPDALRLQQQINPGQLTVIRREDPPPGPPLGPPPMPPSAEVSPAEGGAVAAPPAPAELEAEKPEKATEKKEPNACLIWNELAVTDADKLERLAVGKFSALKLKRRNPSASGTYWVFIPPSANRQEADAKAAELKELGAPEFLIVQDAGPNRFAISLGVFSTQEAANKRLAALREIKVSGALVGERNLKSALASLEARGPQGAASALREAALALLPKSKATSCKAAQAR